MIKLDNIVVIIENSFEEWDWKVNDVEKYGLLSLESDRYWKTKRSAVNNWKKFAKLNKIKNYTIEYDIS
mgnify:CR=1 FL=1